MICRKCGDEAGGGSMGGRDICGTCDCYPPGEAKLMKRIRQLETENRQLRAEAGTMTEDDMQFYCMIPSTATELPVDEK